MKNLYIHHHLGLGDHFDCNGMVRYILKNSDFDRVSVFAKSNYYSMIQYMYRDDDNINIIKVDINNEMQDVNKYLIDNSCEFFLRVGHENYPWAEASLNNNKNCWEFFYDQVRIPYNIRYDMFHVDRDLSEEQRVFKKLNPKNEPFIFMHDDPSRGYKMNREHFINPSLKIIENDVTENIFHFIKILQEAEEIHCMESSFKTLVDFYCKQDNVFFHDFRNHPLGNYSRAKWKIVEYK